MVRRSFCTSRVHYFEKGTDQFVFVISACGCEVLIPMSEGAEA
jgi:hypothetical protein